MNPGTLQNFSNDFDTGLNNTLNASTLLNELMNTTLLNNSGTDLNNSMPLDVNATSLTDVNDNMSYISSGIIENNIFLVVL